MNTRQKNPGFAAIMSLAFPGTGQLYNGEIIKGLLFMFVQVVNTVLLALLVGFLFMPLVWMFGIYDAYKSAEKINEKHESKANESMSVTVQARTGARYDSYKSIQHLLK